MDKVESLYFIRLAQERDLAERDSREKETKILNLTRELDELRELFDKQKSLTTSQQRELDDLMSSKDDVGKSVRFNSFTY